MADSISPDIPDEYLEQVKDILAHLYDYPYLQNHQWAQSFLDEGLSRSQAGQQLRRRFINAIDSLNPDRVKFFREPAARLYSLLHCYYVEGFNILELIDELSLSRRQIYRDLKRGQLAIAEYLYTQDDVQALATEVELSMSDVSSIEQEISQLKYNFRPVNMCQLMRDAIRSIRPLCEQKDIDFELSVPVGAVSHSTDRAIAEQILVSILSQIIAHLDSASIRFSIEETKDATAITLAYPITPSRELDFSTLSRLIRQLDWSVQYTTQDDLQIVTIVLQASTGTIMIIDDNQALLQLLHRYLSTHQCQVFTVSNGEKGWELLQSIVPDALIMDVMMPELDGWELLQRIRSNPVTQHIPVIVCTVFNNSELAFALGATDFLHKPVDQGMISQALKRIGVI